MRQAWRARWAVVGLWVVAGCPVVCPDRPRCDPGQEATQCPETMQACVEGYCTAPSETLSDAGKGTASSGTLSSSAGSVDVSSGTASSGSVVSSAMSVAGASSSAGGSSSRAAGMSSSAASTGSGGASSVGTSSGASSSGNASSRRSNDLVSELCGNGLPSPNDVVTLSEAALAASAQRHWDGTGTVSRFPRLRAGTRGNAVVRWKDTSGRSFVTVALPPGAGGQLLEQFVLNPDGTLAWNNFSNAQMTPFFPAGVQVGRHALLLGGFLTDEVASITAMDAGVLSQPVPELLPVGQLNVARSLPAATVEGCLVLVNGGFSNNATALPLSTELLRVHDDGSVTAQAPRFGALPVMRDGHAAVFHAGTLTVVGGLVNGAATQDGLRLDLDGGVASLGDALQVPRGGMAVAPLANGRVLLLGGGRVSDQEPGSAGTSNRSDSEVVDVSQGDVVARPGPALLSPRFQVAAAATPRGVVVAGGCRLEGAGCAGSAQDTLEWIPAGDSRVATWQVEENNRMATAREGPVVVYHRDRLYVGAGSATGPAWEWRQNNGNGFGPPQMLPQSTVLSQRGACAYQNGDWVWLLGGQIGDDQQGPHMKAVAVRCNLAVDPPTCEDVPAASMMVLRQARAWHTCVVHEDQLFVLGGTRENGTPAAPEVWPLDSQGNLTGPSQELPSVTLSAPEAHGVWDGDELVVSGTGASGGAGAVTRVRFPADGGVPAVVADSELGGPAVPRQGAATARLGPLVLFLGGAATEDGGPSQALQLGKIRQGGAAPPQVNSTLAVPVAHARAAWVGPQRLCLFGGTTTPVDRWPRTPVDTVQCANVFP